jgi:hypothetical protein
MSILVTSRLPLSDHDLLPALVAMPKQMTRWGPKRALARNAFIAFSNPSNLHLLLIKTTQDNPTMGNISLPGNRRNFCRLATSLACTCTLLDSMCILHKTHGSMLGTPHHHP